MNNSARDLELDLLRVFVTVVDSGGFTRAAECLHSTQSTVSQQIRRLEERLATPLLIRDTRRVGLTERGELFLGYARRLLALSEETLAALSETQLQGDVRIGSAQEIADGGLADLLGHFSRLHPGVRLEVTVDANLRLREKVEQGELDLALLFQEPGQQISGTARCEVFQRLRRVWVASLEFTLNDNQPLPLVLPVAPCIFRNAVLHELDAIGRPWRVVLSTPSLAGIRAALRAGLGVGVRTERWLESDMRIIEEGLPPLPDVELALVSATETGEEVVERLREAVRKVVFPAD